MSIHLYSKVSLAASRKITHSYSTSFSLGIMALEKKFRDPIRAIYGFVRLADEIVDTFSDADQVVLLEELKKETYHAIERKISINPVIHAFQEIVNLYNIDIKLIEHFLNSMEMDLHFNRYNLESYKQYIYGSAEAVGLMCLYIFCDGNKEAYDRLEKPARILGSAFQKINFLRDIQDDYTTRGRLYFPGISNLGELNQELLKPIKNEISKEFEEALDGILKLPKGARRGVYIAYIYYLRLFKKIVSSEPSLLLKVRIRIDNFTKIILFIRGYFNLKMA